MPPNTRESLPEVARRLAAIIGQGAQGAALARTLAREGVRTRADLRRPAILARLPRESQALVRFNPRRGVPLATAESTAAEVERRAVFTYGEGRPRHLEVIPVGSVRRRAPYVKDFDYLVVVPDADAAYIDRVLPGMTLGAAAPGDKLKIADNYAAGTRRRSFILERAPEIRASTARPARSTYYLSDFFVTTTEEKPFALFHYTGSSAYNIRTRAHAKRKGWKLNQYGLFDSVTGRRVRGSSAIRTEKDLAEFLGVSYRLPTDRAR